ncbi:MAG TPA: histidine phosphatase family protein [Candidatus Saccharimonadales bacterium]
MAVEIFLARHGQNEDNAEGLLNGRRDRPLTELGREQARQLAQGIKDAGLTFDVIYSSPLVRAYETADIVRRALGMKDKPTVIPELIERDFGEYTGKTPEWAVEDAGSDIIPAEKIMYLPHPPGGETFPQLVARGQTVLEKVRALHASGRVLLVAHGDIGKMTYAAATGRPWRSVLTDFHFGNGELLDLAPGGKAHVIQLEQFNQ